MAKITIQLGEDEFGMVSGGEEGELDYGETAELDTPDGVYSCTIEDPDTEWEDIQVTIKRPGSDKDEPVTDIEVIEAEFQGGEEDDDEDEDDLEEDDEETEEEEEDEEATV